MIQSGRYTPSYDDYHRFPYLISQAEMSKENVVRKGFRARKGQVTAPSEDLPKNLRFRK
jgi:hypothetical protein